MDKPVSFEWSAERVPGPGTSVKKSSAFRRTRLPVLPRNISEAEEDSCSLGLSQEQTQVQTVNHLRRVVSKPD